jgi:hypothetical protein
MRNILMLVVAIFILLCSMVHGDDYYVVIVVPTPDNSGINMQQDYRTIVDPTPVPTPYPQY